MTVSKPERIIDNAHFYYYRYLTISIVVYENEILLIFNLKFVILFEKKTLEKFD